MAGRSRRRRCLAPRLMSKVAVLLSGYRDEVYDLIAKGAPLK